MTLKAVGTRKDLVALLTKKLFDDLIDKVVFVVVVFVEDGVVFERSFARRHSRGRVLIQRGGQNRFSVFHVGDLQSLWQDE